MRTEVEIKEMCRIISNNKNLSYAYGEDVLNVLRWVLGGEIFDGGFDDIENEKK